MRKKECIAMLLAGGQGSRLGALTKYNAKPAVAFGGKYRIIDFGLSNCVNSGIDTVGVLTQYKPLSLNDYLGTGTSWDLDDPDGGLHVLAPYATETGGRWYNGTADAIYRNIDFISRYDPEYVLILSGDHLYHMDYNRMLAYHKKQKAALTVAVIEVTMEEASRFGIMNVDERDIIYEFEEKPPQPKSTLASMGIYIFTWQKLREYLIADENDPASSNDFGKNVIPAMLNAGEVMAAYRFSGYWRDVGTIESLWDANMDLLSYSGGVQLYDRDWPIYARSPGLPPQVTGRKAVLSHSMLTGGCSVNGTVENSVLFHSVTVEEGATVRYSILMPGTVVKAGAVVDYAIVAENAVIGAGAKVGTPPDGNNPDDWGVAVVAQNIKVGDGCIVPAKAMVTEDMERGLSK